MNANQPRNSNLIVCYSLVFIGILCILGTIFAALYLKNGIIERVSEPIRLEPMVDAIHIDSINRQIESKERDIEFEKKMPDLEQSMDEARKKFGMKTNSTNSNFEQKKADKIKKLEEEKQQLIAKRDEAAGNTRAKEMKPRTWRELYIDYDIELFIAAVLPLGVLSLVFMRLVFGGRLPARNPLSLTDFERRSVLFLIFALIFSAFGFFLFVWILTLIY